MNTYHVMVNYVKDFSTIELNIYIDNPNENPESGYISAGGWWDHEHNELKFYIRPHVQFSGVYTADSALDVSDWWRLAALAVNILPYYIRNRDDLSKLFTAKIIGGSLAIDEITATTIVRK